jgi:hypothetical protein
MNDICTRAVLRDALSQLQRVSDSHQFELNNLAAEAGQKQLGPRGIGRLLSLSRQVETLERLSRELAELLGVPPPPRQLAPVPPREITAA